MNLFLIIMVVLIFVVLIYIMLLLDQIESTLMNLKDFIVRDFSTQLRVEHKQKEK